MSTLQFEEVTIGYGPARRSTEVVRAVDLVVDSGSIVGLVGESGSGKSTLAKAAVGLVRPTAGRVLVDGSDITRLRGAQRPVHMVFQDPYSSLNPRLRVGDTIRESLPKQQRRDRNEVGRLLELVQLDQRHADSLPHELSGGQRQRVAVARALAANPRFVVADEMTSALDVSVQAAMLNLVRRIRDDLGVGFLFISHDLAVVHYVCDEVAVMEHGRIVERGAVERVIGQPQHPYTATLVSAVGQGAR